MPAIPTVVGGHTIRDPPQLDAGAAVNMFPERSQRETEYQSRRAKFQLSTHGYERFNLDTSLPGVTAMRGSRERNERLAVANGRTLRLFKRPGSQELTDLTVSGQPARGGGANRQQSPRLIPTLGCAHVGGATRPWYWVRQDGAVWWNATTPADRPPATNGVYDGAPIETDDNLGGITPLGMAVQAGSSPPDANRIWLTCFEDRRIRCWRKVTRPAGERRFERDVDHDLDLAEETAANSPESLWFDQNENLLLILDAVTGRVLEYSFNEGKADAWTRETPSGANNPFSIQKLNGDRDTLEPLVYGGIHGNATELRVVNREEDKYTIANRRTALRVSADTTTENLPDVRETPGSGPNVYIGGAVSGGTARSWFVSGTQYSDGLCRVYQNTAPLTYSRLTTLPRMPDALPATPRPTQIVPLGNRGRFMGWVLQRRLHLIDLENDRVIQNVEGQIDRLDVTRDQFIAADAGIGEIKASPLFQVQGAPGATDSYGQRVEAASLRVFGVGLDDDGAPELEEPENIIDAYVGVREVLVVTAQNRLLYYERRHLEPNPDAAARAFRPTYLNAPSDPTDPLPDARKVYGVCVAGAQMAIFLASGSNLVMRQYAVPPRTKAEFDNSSNYVATSFSLPLPGIDGVASIAASTTRLFVLSHLDTIGTRLLVYNRQTQARITRLDLGADNAKRTELFGHLNLTSFDTDTIRAITFLTDYDPRTTSPTEGFLLLSAYGPEETQAVAIELHGTGMSEDWQRAAARDLPPALTRNNRILTHDGQFVFDSSTEYAPVTNPDGVPVRIMTLTALRHALVASLNQYTWPQETRNLSGASSIAAIRRWMYTWSPTGMEIRDQGDRTVGFPYRLTETRTIGITSPRSIAVVADRLYWLGVTEGGGLRVWVLGRKGDTVPEPVYGKAIEEMLDRIAEERPGALERAVAWADDTGGHPTYVLHVRDAGISLAYDADADRWHMRTSLRETPIADRDNLWAAWLPNTEGVQRVTHSTAWRGRLICGGYDRNGASVLAFFSQSDWRDIDRGPVLRRRQFSAGEAERERIFFNKLRVDTTYRTPSGVPAGADARAIQRALNAEFTVSYSNDGGVSFPVELPPRRVAAEPPQPFYRIGQSRQRVYRVDCHAPIPFALMGAYQEAMP